MDQNHFQYQENQTTFRVKKYAADYRARARALLKPSYWVAVAATFVAGLLGGTVSSGNANFSVSMPSTDDVDVGNLADQIEYLAQLFREEGLMAVLNAHPLIMFTFVGILFGVVFGFLFRTFVGGPVALGYQKFNLDIVDGKPVSVSSLFDYFGKCYLKSAGLRVVYDLIISLIGLPLVLLTAILCWVNRGALLHAMLLRASAGEYATFALVLIVISLASIATVVVQTVVQYRYGFCFMILAEYPEIGVFDALRNSAALMNGNKWRYFCLNFSFIGWILLTALVASCTCGLGALGFIFLQPYVNAASAVFYDDIANRRAADDVDFPSIDPNDYTVG